MRVPVCTWCSANGLTIQCKRPLCGKMMDYDCFSSMSVCGSCWVVATDGVDLSGGRMPFSCGGIKRKVAVLGLCVHLWTGGGARPPVAGEGLSGRVLWQGRPRPCCKAGAALPQRPPFLRTWRTLRETFPSAKASVFPERPRWSFSQGATGCRTSQGTGRRGQGGLTGREGLGTDLRRL